MKIYRKNGSYRKTTIETEDLQISDRIDVELEGFGKFTATLQQINPAGFIFMLDQRIAEGKAMNEDYDKTNEGGFAMSDLCHWINNSIINAFPQELRERIEWVTLPSAEQIFGPDNLIVKEDLEPTNDTFFPLMKRKKNRQAFLGRIPDYYWLRNATKKVISDNFFASVNPSGGLCHGAAWISFDSVRPIFFVRREV